MRIRQDRDLCLHLFFGISSSSRLDNDEGAKSSSAERWGRRVYRNLQGPWEDVTLLAVFNLVPNGIREGPVLQHSSYHIGTCSKRCVRDGLKTLDLSRKSCRLGGVILYTTEGASLALL